LLAKQHDKRKESFGKHKKARAHSAHVRVNFDDDSTMPRLSSGSADDNDSCSSASAVSSDAASSHGVKVSKKTRQRAHARVNAALSNRGCAHSNFAAVVSSFRSRASAVSLPSASVLGFSKKRRNHLIFDSGDDSATEVSVVRKKHKKESKLYASSHACSILGALPREPDDDNSPGDKLMFMKASSAAFPHSRATNFAAKAKATYQPSRNCQSSSSSRLAQAYSVQILWLAKPQLQLSHSIPEWFLLCESGATHHMFNHRMFLANIRDTYLEVSWGDSSSSWSHGLGSMIGMSYYSASMLLQCLALSPVELKMPFLYLIALTIWRLCLVSVSKDMMFV